MKNICYIDNIKHLYTLDNDDICDILEYLVYIARDNGEIEADYFLRKLQNIIDN